MVGFFVGRDSWIQNIWVEVFFVCTNNKH
jgi:hypothetical protein